jgi:gamma-glutamylcysteine synthetase
LTSLSLADPTFGKPGRINILLGVDIFAEVLRQGRRTDPAGSPVAFTTEFRWVLSGQAESSSPTERIITHHTSAEFKVDTLRKFWEIEEAPTSEAALSVEE